ncbi:hypothetical protein JHN55_07035 [Streptomyces sp. MBT56]|uniref:hypothetical protein n=1 Tax=unclassified Streptomyces TaxID=2593676 RepID=UPI0019099A48|nr:MULTISPECIES: hypothetical protein [unclassified Streptomyces]MBK3556293.1 hypothetical protein [Streptomyces sp. MBT56]MBK3601241.1 hypothetical protein [Streptomyces sp. MBT54]MBK3614523.1 hypothetical protein [Streptomyces sp. MBT98]MBK6042832.1 hypothetical protein [Streptomyces sp. MBT55]
MGRVRVSAGVRARAGVFTGGVLTATGAGLGLGLAVGLAVAGVLLVAYCLLLMDVDGGSK